MVNTTLNKFGKKLPPVKTGQRFGDEIKKDKKVGLFSERRFLIFTKRGPIEIAFKPIHYASVIMTTIIGLTSIIYWSAKGIHSAIDVAKKNDIITKPCDIDTLKSTTEEIEISYLKRPFGRPNRIPADEQNHSTAIMNRKLLNLKVY